MRLLKAFRVFLDEEYGGLWGLAKVLAFVAFASLAIGLPIGLMLRYEDRHPYTPIWETALAPDPSLTCWKDKLSSNYICTPTPEE